MRVLGLIVQIALGCSLLAATFILGAFHSEVMRGRGGLFSIFLSLLTWVVMAGPLIMAFIHPVTQSPAPLKNFLRWLAAFVLFAACGWGLFIADETLGPATAKIENQFFSSRLLARAQAGDEQAACELVIQKGADDVFPICKKRIESLRGKPEHWLLLQEFTIGSSFLTTHEKQNRSVIPASEQVWFLNEFFRALIEAPPLESSGGKGVTTAPNEEFDDLLCLGNLFSSLAQGNEWTAEAVRSFKVSLLPAVMDRYEARLRQAVETSNDRASWVRENLKALEAR